MKFLARPTAENYHAAGSLSKLVHLLRPLERNFEMEFCKSVSYHFLNSSAVQIKKKKDKS